MLGVCCRAGPDGRLRDDAYREFFRLLLREDFDEARRVPGLEWDPLEADDLWWTGRFVVASIGGVTNAHQKKAIATTRMFGRKTLF